MPITVKHTKVSTIPDDADTSLVRPSDWNADHALTGVIDVANGGTGAATLTGYVKGNGTSAMTAVATVPNTDVTGLGTMSTQNANNVNITGGSITGVTGVGTVTSVTGTSPVVSSGGNTPAISMPAATTSVNGYLTSTDWNTFNGKGNGTVTSVGGTGTVNGISLSGTVTSTGNLTLGGTLTGVSLATQVTGTLPIANGGTNATTAADALTSLGAYPASNPNGYTSNTGTVTSIIAGTGLSGGTITTSGTIAIDSTVTTNSGTQTLTNKRVNPRAVAAGSTSGTLTPNGDTTDVFNAFGLTGAITVATPSGTPVDGQRLMLRFKDNGTGRGITWTGTSGAYRAVGVTLPTTTVASKVTYVGCVYNSTDVFWDAIAVATQAQEITWLIVQQLILTVLSLI